MKIIPGVICYLIVPLQSMPSIDERFILRPYSYKTNRYKIFTKLIFWSGKLSCTYLYEVVRFCEPNLLCCCIFPLWIHHGLVPLASICRQFQRRWQNSDAPWVRYIAIRVRTNHFQRGAPNNDLHPWSNQRDDQHRLTKSDLLLERNHNHRIPLKSSDSNLNETTKIFK